MECENSISRGNPILGCGCFKNRATKIVKVIYKEWELDGYQCDSDTLHLCPSCAKAITTDAKHHEYKVIVT